MYLKKLALFSLIALSTSLSAAAKQKQPPAPACSRQSEPLDAKALSAYSSPAVIDVTFQEDREVGIFGDASFIYWYVGQEGMGVATSSVIGTTNGVNYLATNTTSNRQNFNYTPGFKVGLGIVGQHDWQIYAQYTWIRTTNSQSAGAPSDALTAGTTTVFSGTPVWAMNDWFLQGTTSGAAFSASNVSSKWHLAADIIDLSASRPYYQGRNVTINPFAGLRALLLRQKMTVSLTESPILFTSAMVPLPAPAQPITSLNRSQCWSIGPRFGADAKALLPMGFRLEGDAAFSLLYTQYTKITHQEQVASLSFNPGPYRASLTGIHVLRPIAEVGLGFGWGRYLYCSDYHIDFSATYDFTYLWNQNMMRRLMDDTLVGASPSSSDLFFHGLTVTGRFDF